MKLTGKVQRAFETWFEENLYAIHVGEPERYPMVVADIFDTAPDSMKYGVYVDFFDSIGINIIDITDCWQIMEGNNVYRPEDITSSRQIARTEAINKANEIYNNQER